MNLDPITWHTQIAREFEAKYETSPAFIERRRIWRDAIERTVRPGFHVLDVGCGTGELSLIAAPRCRHVLGIDASRRMIDICRERKEASGAANVDFDVLPLELLPCSGNIYFDLILCSSVLEYVEDFWSALGILATRLVPGGLLLVSVPNSLSLYRWLERRVFAVSGRPAYFKYVRHIPDARALTTGIEAHGLETLSVHHYGWPPLPTSLGRRIATHETIAPLALYTCRRSA